MNDVLTNIYEKLSEYGLKVVAALVILVIGIWIAKLISRLVGKAMERSKLDNSINRFVQSICFIAILAFVIVGTLEKLGVNTTSFAAAIAAAGLAIGLALQGSLSNFAAGILLIVLHPFKVGDFVEISGVKGVVQYIHIFNTIINSPDNIKIIVPNSQITGGNILNYSINGTRRVDLVVGVSYEDDLKKAKEIIAAVLEADPMVLKSPAYTVAVSELADSSVNFVVRPWVKAADYWDAYFAVTENVKNALDENGITIPFPQRDVHMIQESA